MITPSIHRDGNRLDYSDFDLSVVSFLDPRTINPVEKIWPATAAGQILVY
jgi:hypothetical protein